MTSPQLRHGIRHTYNYYGCRCEQCTEANRRDAADGRARRRAGRQTPKSRAVDPERRFPKFLREGAIPDYRPDLGPCLIFTGADNGGGYGQFRWDGHNGYAHRYAWERANGPIPAGLTVDHLCRVRRCVELSHLELVDGVTNFLRGVAARTACPNGHPYEGDTYRIVKGRRNCLICLRATMRRDGQRRLTGRPGDERRSVRYPQALVRQQLALVRFEGVRIADAARIIGCHPNYLGRRAWEETQRAVLDRDPVCVRCMVAPSFDAHHRLPRGQGGSANSRTSFGMANIIGACRSCHDWVESNRRESYRLGYLVHSYQRPCDVPVWYLVRWVRLHDSGEAVPVSAPVDAA